MLGDRRQESAMTTRNTSRIAVLATFCAACVRCSAARCIAPRSGTSLSTAARWAGVSRIPATATLGGAKDAVARSRPGVRGRSSRRPRPAGASAKAAGPRQGAPLSAAAVAAAAPSERANIELYQDIQRLAAWIDAKKDIASRLGREPSAEEWAAAVGVRARDLAQQIQRARQASARLVNVHAGLVTHVAQRYRGCGVSLQDLRQEAAMGLVRASAKFQPERGFTFATFAYYHMRAALSKLSARRAGDAVALSYNAAAQVRSLERCMAAAAAMSTMAAAADQQQPPTAAALPAEGARGSEMKLSDAKLAELSGISEARVATLRRYTSNGWRTLSVDDLQTGAAAKASAASPAAFAFGAGYGGGGDDAAGRIDAEDARTRLRVAMKVLSERQRDVLQLRYGLAQDGVPRNLKEVAAKLGVSLERVRQIEVAAILKLKLDQERADLEAATRRGAAAFVLAT